MKRGYFKILSIVTIIMVILISGCVKENTYKQNQSLSKQINYTNQIKYNNTLCNKLANKLDNVAMNLTKDNEFIGGILISKKYSYSYYGHSIDVEDLVFEGINNQLKIKRINDGQESFQIGMFYKFNLSSIKSYNPLSGKYGSPSGFSDKKLNKLEKIDCR